MVVGNMILFLTVALVVVFVFLLLWGFVMGENIKIDDKKVKWGAAAIICVALAIAVLWATNSLSIFITIYNWLFHQTWSEEFWINAIFIIAIAGAIASVLKSAKGEKS